MFRLVGLLIVVAIMGLLWVTVVDGMSSDTCDDPSATTVPKNVSGELPDSVKGLLPKC